MSTQLYDNSSVGFSTEPTNSSGLEYYPLIRQPIHMIIVYSVAYGVVFLLGVVGNGLVVCVVLRTPSMNTVTNYFIVNLAVADLLVGLFCLPITLLANIFSGWRFGAVMCKLIPYLQGVAVCASVNTLGAISVDRYLAICRVLEFRITRKIARLVITLIWLYAMVVISPWAVYFQEIPVPTSIEPMNVCDQIWPSEELKRGYFLGVIVLTCYTVPLMFITVFYTCIGCRVWNRDALGNSANSAQIIQRSKMRVVKMLIVVVIMFTFCWMPLYAVNIRLYFGPPVEFDGPEFNMLFQTIVPVAQWFGISSCSVNPIVYCLFSGKFRAGYRSLIVSASCFRFCCGKWAANAQSMLSPNPTISYGGTMRHVTIGNGTVRGRFTCSERSPAVESNSNNNSNSLQTSLGQSQCQVNTVAVRVVAPGSQLL